MSPILLFKRLIALILIAIILLALYDYPFAKMILAIGLGIYAAILYRYPDVWLIAVPALLPVLDLTPWSGWFFFDEFDLVILTTLAVSLWRGAPRHATARTPAFVKIALVALTLSYLASLLIGLFPLDPLDANAFANYFTRYNSLRVAKGFFLAIFLLYLTPRSLAPEDQKLLLTTGMILGLVGVNICVLYERFIFAGLFNFSNDLRAVGTFSGLHNGGNDIEAYLVFAAPFIVAWVFEHRTPSMYLAGAAIFALTSYSLLVTFSRGGYLGFIVAWIALILCLLVWASSRSFSLPPLKAPSFAIFLVLLGAGIAVPIMKGDFIRARFATVALDWQSRLDQLRNTFRMMDDNSMTSLLGMGLGRFPATYTERQPARFSPTVYTFETQSNNTFLRIKAGSPLYIGQRIRTKPGTSYLLALDLRSVNQKAGVKIPICEKQLQSSFRCQWVEFSSNQIGAWEHFEKRVNMGEVGGDIGRISGRLSRRPVELGLYSPARGSVLDIDNVRLLDDTGSNLVSNGDFSGGHDRWFFTVDDLMPWQSSNHWGQMFFEQGWSGLLAFNLFIACVLMVCLVQIRRGDLFSAVVLAGMLGFLAVGLFGSLFDTPRMATLFYFLSLFPVRCRGDAAAAETEPGDE